MNGLKPSTTKWKASSKPKESSVKITAHSKANHEPNKLSISTGSQTSINPARSSTEMKLFELNSTQILFLERYPSFNSGDHSWRSKHCKLGRWKTKNIRHLKHTGLSNEKPHQNPRKVVEQLQLHPHRPRHLHPPTHQNACPFPLLKNRLQKTIHPSIKRHGLFRNSSKFSLRHRHRPRKNKCLLRRLRSHPPPHPSPQKLRQQRHKQNPHKNIQWQNQWSNHRTPQTQQWERSIPHRQNQINRLCCSRSRINHQQNLLNQSNQKQLRNRTTNSLQRLHLYRLQLLLQLNLECLWNAHSQRSLQSLLKILWPLRRSWRLLRIVFRRRTYLLNQLWHPRIRYRIPLRSLYLPDSRINDTRQPHEHQR